MIDTAAIKENYARMHDNQLLHIMQTDGHLLTTEAFEILKHEIEKRKLDTVYVENALDKKTALHNEQIEIIKNSDPENFAKATFEFLVTEKQKGTAGNVIIEGLVERGMEHAAAVQLESSAIDRLNELVTKCNTKMLVSGSVFLLCLFFNMVSYTNAMVKGGSYYIITGVTLFSIFSFFKSWSEKNKYTRIVKSISETGL